MFGQLAKKQWQKFSDSIMLRFNETEVAKEEFYGVKKKKKKKKNWDVDVNIFIS